MNLLIAFGFGVLATCVFLFFMKFLDPSVSEQLENRRINANLLNLSAIFFGVCCATMLAALFYQAGQMGEQAREVKTRHEDFHVLVGQWEQHLDDVSAETSTLLNLIRKQLSPRAQAKITQDFEEWTMQRALEQK